MAIGECKESHAQLTPVDPSGGSWILVDGLMYAQKSNYGYTHTHTRKIYIYNIYIYYMFMYIYICIPQWILMRLHHADVHFTEFCHQIS